ncbi:MAG: tetratricopeptide repeat protein, partial [Actinobacteria bacterium]|nr:tetratricopeptide repeat protein [Actinomycetota bacterium]
RLGFLFWPDVPDEAARHNVRQLLKRIRRLEWLVGFDVEGDDVRWSVATDVADLWDAMTAERWDDLPAVADLLPGFERNATIEFEGWLLGERRRIHDRWRSALLAAAAAAGEGGAPDRGARLLEPLLEDADGGAVLARYMDLAARAGAGASAVDAFDRVAARLRDEVGVDPPVRVQELADRLRSRRDGGPPPDEGLIVGRSDEVTELAGLLSQPSCRLLTLLGPGGIGKSTLARMLLGRLAAGFRDGVAFVPLESVSDPAALPSVVAATLGVALDGRMDPVTQLAHALRARELLLVLDNAEHLVDGWLVIPALLDACPRLRVVVTTRERLRLDDEWVYAVDGLGDDEGVELFERRARRVAPEATVARADARAVCRAVGGSPLGIELAAPWLRVMSGHEVVALIDRDPATLSGGGRDASPRHRSLEAAMAHSWELASAEERTAVEALSVFAAPYSRQLAAAVADVVPTLLRDLVDKSLVQRRSDDLYASHPLVRQYAAACLAADDPRRRDARHRHADVVLGELARREAKPARPGLLDDALQAWEHASEHGDLELLRSSVGGLVTLLDATGRYGHGLQLLTGATTRLDGTGARARATVASLHHGRAILLDRLGRHREAAMEAEAAIGPASAAGEARLLVLAHVSLGWARKWTDGDPAQYAATLDALPIAESLQDDDLVATVLEGLGCSAPTLEECRQHLLAGLALRARRIVRADLLHSLGSVEWALGDDDAALGHLGEALAIARSDGHLPAMVASLTNLAFIHGEQGDLRTAQRLSTEAGALIGDLEAADLTVRAEVVAGEIQRRLGDAAGARSRMYRALRMASTINNDALSLRSLRLHGQLLVDEGELEDGLGTLAFVLSRTDRRGDFTCEIVNPRVWAESTASVEASRVEDAQEWARGRDLASLVATVLASR